MPIKSSRVKQLWVWLVEARLVWLNLAVIIIALIVAIRLHTPEPMIRITGLLAQLVGIFTVLKDISKTQALFKLPSFIAKAKSWLKRFPLRRNNIVIAADATIIGTSACKFRGDVTQGPSPNPTIETRLDVLEKNISLIRERISDIEREIYEEFHKTKEALKNEEQARQAGDNDVRKELENAETGGAFILSIGALWLLVGVILSTASVEIVEVLKWMRN
jgi:hypothetical protein